MQERQAQERAMPDYAERHMRSIRSLYPKLVLLWLGVALAGCIFGAAKDGARSIIPNFIRYGVGVGAVISLLLVVAYAVDHRMLRRRGSEGFPAGGNNGGNKEPPNRETQANKGS